MASDTNKETSKRGSPRRLIGVVATSTRNKTIKVIVESMHKHPKYGKYLRKRTVCHAHDETNQAQSGDSVEIQECRPISKTKCWRLVRVVEKSRTGQAAATGAEG